MSKEKDDNRARTWTDMYGVIHILKYEEEF